MSSEFACHVACANVPQDHCLIRAAGANLAAVEGAVKRNEVLDDGFNSVFDFFEPSFMTNYGIVSPVSIQNFIPMPSVCLQQGAQFHTPQLQRFVTATGQQIVPIH